MRASKNLGSAKKDKVNDTSFSLLCEGDGGRKVQKFKRESDFGLVCFIAVNSQN
jgi:hypothetical protein